MSSPIGDILREMRSMKEEMVKMKRTWEKAMKDEQDDRKKAIKDEHDEWKAKMKCLEEKMKHQDETERRLGREIQDMQAQLADTSGWLVHADTEALDRIRLRNLLDEAQAVLAHACGLTTGDSYAAVTPAQHWRNHLSTERTDQARLAKARSMLENLSSTTDPIQQFILSPSGALALIIVTQKSLPIRKNGDVVAHESQLDPTKYGSVIECQGGVSATQAALRDLLALVTDYIKH